MNDYKWAESTLATARSQQDGKPLQNNTRLYQRGEDSYAVRLHNTDVIIFNSDGTYTLRAGGYHTVTTLDRIRTYAPVNHTLISEQGEWFVRLEPDPADPSPQRVDRTVPKPFEASDPGPEPVKSSEGCVAGQLITTEHVNEIVELMWRKDMREDDELVEVTGKGYRDDPDFDKVKVQRSWNDHVWIGEDYHSYHDEGWNQLTGSRNYSGATHYINDNEHVEYVQCSHCKEFDALHENWRYRMHGDRWGVKFDQQTGYRAYREMMDRFGSMEAWHEAYLADFRARRAYLQAEREWQQRNRVPFYDGIVVNAEGYAPRERKGGPSKKKLDRHERKVAAIKKRINKYVDGYIEALKQGMPMPGGGDCWYCVMRTQDGQTLGDAVQTLHPDGSLTVEQNHDHLFSHMKEKYYVPSLAVNALRERGYKDVGVMIWLDMEPENNRMGKQDGRYDNVKRDIRHYLVKRLVPDAPTK